MCETRLDTDLDTAREGMMQAWETCCFVCFLVAIIQTLPAIPCLSIAVIPKVLSVIWSAVNAGCGCWLMTVSVLWINDWGTNCRCDEELAQCHFTLSRLFSWPQLHHTPKQCQTRALHCQYSPPDWWSESGQALSGQWWQVWPIQCVNSSYESSELWLLRWVGE